jgi:hypothetical protein
MIVGVGVGGVKDDRGCWSGRVRADHCRLKVRVIRWCKNRSLGIHEPSDRIDWDGAIKLGLE